MNTRVRVWRVKKKSNFRWPLWQVNIEMESSQNLWRQEGKIMIFSSRSLFCILKIKLMKGFLWKQQEHLQKFLQLPKSPSSTQVVETKQEPKQEPKPEASCSSSSPSRNASPSTLSPSPSSSTFTVHHLPSVKEKASSPKGISEDKSENEPSAGVSSSESPKLTESKNVEEIELTSTTTTGDGQSLLEKLLQHHLKAVENNRKESSTKVWKYFVLDWITFFPFNRKS